MSIKVNRCTNANVYVDGNSYMGRAEEITLPEYQAKMSDHKALGMVGESELPAGLQKMSAKFKWNAIYEDVMKKTHDVYSAFRIMVRTSVETWEGGTRVSQVPAVIYLTGNWKKTGGLGFKAQDNVETESEMNVTAYKMEINGEEIVDIDILNNRWRVAGVDQLATYRANLGL
ncbi:phage major tail tube protein [Foetidibacter luteolus]|uniref:phage major tail tube protein n=1 Tax=Foetidibacter luteolus TaxID=2608880 RepID=UPI00129A4EF8|nr:phage major tail tube protein [Foetidibacter luteolus]